MCDDGTHCTTKRSSFVRLSGCACSAVLCAQRMEVTDVCVEHARMNILELSALRFCRHTPHTPHTNICASYICASSGRVIAAHTIQPCARINRAYYCVYVCVHANVCIGIMRAGSRCECVCCILFCIYVHVARRTSSITSGTLCFHTGNTGEENNVRCSVIKADKKNAIFTHRT